LVETLRSPLLISSHERHKPVERRLLSFEVPRVTFNEQVQVWREALGEVAGALDGRVETLVSQFCLNPQSIHAAVAQGLSPSQGTQGLGPCGSDAALEARDTASRERLSAALWDACRMQASPRLEGLAQRIEPAAAWDDLVLPERQKQVLRQIALHVRQRVKVYQTWGFASKGSRGLGISALFAGPSGTGKTMAGEVLANELRLDLYRIDLSQVVSKYIGETEKNLRRVFDAAEDGAAVLLFDEADALFGKRSEVKDSHDRYANIEVSYLLQRMEAYRGLAILTTNRKEALDPAFLRRIRFLVEFPFPEAAQRAEIWRRVFPRQTPTEGLRIDRLARLSAAGGNIYNIAMGAAFLAADGGEPVRMSHLLAATRCEFAKLERPLTDSETSGWV
jgi:ATP-dependent 26S proteasome regulatory subunit